MQLIKRVALLGLATALSAHAVDVSLSGTVVDSATQKGLSNVVVSLAKGGLSPTTTLSDGSWTLNGAVTGIAGRHGTTAVSGTSHLSVQDGHILLRYEGHDLLGHSQPVASVATASVAALARSSSVALDTIDTLLFSLNGTIRFRKPITSYAQSGIITVLDTSSAVVVTGDTNHFTDSRDGQTYKYVTIGTQTWMAQNLNYRNTSGKADTVGVCYNDWLSNCTTYGRLYTWSEVMAGTSSSAANPSGVQGVCPSGWHVPSDTEWGTLVAYVGRDSARVNLSSTSKWDSCKSCTWTHGNGTDKYGFSVLPAGNHTYDDGPFVNFGNSSFFWSSTESGSCAWDRSFSNGNLYMERHNSNFKSYGFSLRCLRASSDSVVVTNDTNHFTDSRDGQTYKYVTIGTQTWMAQNLNYRNTSGKADTVGVCYNDWLSNCTTYGRLYTWSEVMAGTSSSAANPSGVQGVCPSGWHVPSDTEWGTLVAYVGRDSARVNLSSTSKWDSCKSCTWTHGNGTDKYGFSVLPAGNHSDDGSFVNFGNSTFFWSSTENGIYAWDRSFSSGYLYVEHHSGNYKSYGFSLRCLHN